MSLQVRLVVMFVFVVRFGVMSFWSELAFGRNLVERARGVHSQLVVLIFVTIFRNVRDVTLDFIHARRVRGGRFVHGIRRKMRVRLPLGNGFTGQRFQMRRTG